MSNMLLLKRFFAIFAFVGLGLLVSTPVQAQSGTESAQASQSADDASDSADSSQSALPDELPQTGAADVFILSAAGLIFILAGIFSAQTANEVFREIQDE